MARVLDTGPQWDEGRQRNDVIDGLRGENRRLADELRRARARCGELVRLCTEKSGLESGLCATDFEGIFHRPDPVTAAPWKTLEFPQAKGIALESGLSRPPELTTSDVRGDTSIPDRSVFDGPGQALSQEDLLDFWEGRCAELVREGEEREKQCAQLVAQCTRLIRCVREKEAECRELTGLCAKKDTERQKLQACRTQEDKSEAAQMMLTAALKVELSNKTLPNADGLGTVLLSDVWEELMVHCDQILKDCRIQERRCSELQKECRRHDQRSSELQGECRQKDAWCADLARKCYQHEEHCIELASQCQQVEASAYRDRSVSPASPSRKSFGLDSELNQAEFSSLQSTCQRYEQRWSETLKVSGREEELCAILKSRLQREEDQCAAYAQDKISDGKDHKMLIAEVQERGMMCARLESRIRKEKLRRSCSDEKSELGESRASRSVLVEELQERAAQCSALYEERASLKVRLDAFAQEIQEANAEREALQRQERNASQKSAYWQDEIQKLEAQISTQGVHRVSASILKETQEALRVQEARAGDWEEKFTQLEAAEAPKDFLWQSRFQNLQEVKEAQELQNSRVLEELERHWKDRYSKVESARRSWRERYLELKAAADAATADAKSIQNEEQQWSQCLEELMKEQVHLERCCQEEVELERRWHDLYGKSEQQQLRLRDEVLEAEEQRDAKERQCAALQNDLIHAETAIGEVNSSESLVRIERERRLSDQQEYEQIIRGLRTKLKTAETDCMQTEDREKNLQVRIEELETYLSDKQRGVPQATAERALERASRRSEATGGPRFRGTSPVSRGSSGSSRKTSDSPEFRRRPASDGSLSPTRNRPPWGSSGSQKGSTSLTMSSTKVPTPDGRPRASTEDNAILLRGSLEPSQAAPAHSAALERARRIMAARRQTSSLSRSPSPPAQRGGPTHEWR